MLFTQGILVRTNRFLPAGQTHGCPKTRHLEHFGLPDSSL